MGVILAVVLIAIGATAANHPGTFEHFLGSSERQTATVTRVVEAPFCSRNDRNIYTVEWEQNGTLRSDTLGRCGDPWQIGDEITIWTTSGDPRTSGPLAMRIVAALLAAGLAFAALVIVRGRHRVRRATSRAVDGTWRPRSFATIGRPGDPGFRIDAPVVARPRTRDGRTVIFRSHDGVLPPSDAPGTLYVDELRVGRPRGLSLHTTEAGRVWRWHG